MIDQDRVVNDLKARWQNVLVHDRRIKPSHGYRAVHVIVTIKEHPVEIQVRTSLQHSWASATEKLSDVVDPDVKYGGGPEPLQKTLATISEQCAKLEKAELINAQLLRKVEDLPVEEAEFDEKFTKFVAQDDDRGSRQIAKMIQEQGGIKNFLGKLKQDLREVRDEINAWLKELCKRHNIEY